MTIFDRVKAKIMLSEYALKFIRLQRTGNKLIGLCPFHSETTPSFQIDLAKQLFYCFGCNTGGDIFDFYLRYHNSDKRDALYALANIAGIALHENKKNDLHLLHEFFIANLNNDVKNWAISRGVSEELINKAQLGFAPSAQKTLDFIKNNNLNLNQFGFADYFWKMFEFRLVFPIYNADGRLCSFGGRDVEDIISASQHKRAKYINGPASNVFDKSSTLYSVGGKSGDVYVVEGYFDVLLMEQHGFHAVASMGTSFGKQHLQMLWKRNDNVFIMMDGDVAGQKSAIKIAHLAIELLQPEKAIAFVSLSNLYDPASFLVEGGDVQMLQKINLCDYLFSYYFVSTSNPDVTVASREKLLHLTKKFANKTLAFGYKQQWLKKWRECILTKNPISNIQFADFATNDALALLLFKYILIYPDIVASMQVIIFRAKLSDYFFSQIHKILQHQTVDEKLLLKIDQLNYMDNNITKEEAEKRCYKICAMLGAK
jgi:DNA primase